MLNKRASRPGFSKVWSARFGCFGVYAKDVIISRPNGAVSAGFEKKNNLLFIGTIAAMPNYPSEPASEPASEPTAPYHFLELIAGLDFEYFNWLLNITHSFWLVFMINNTPGYRRFRGLNISAHLSRRRGTFFAHPVGIIFKETACCRQCCALNSTIARRQLTGIKYFLVLISTEPGVKALKAPTQHVGRALRDSVSFCMINFRPNTLKWVCVEKVLLLQTVEEYRNKCKLKSLATAS